MRFDKLIPLIKLELNRSINLNQNRKKFLSGIALNIFIAALLLFYSVSLTFVGMLNFKNYLIAGFFSFTFIMIFINNIIFSNNSLFSKIEFERITPLPLTNIEIMSSKILGIYLTSLFFVVTILLFPTFYFNYIENGTLFLVSSIFMLLFFPLIPISLSLLVTLFLGNFLKNRFVKIIGSIFITFLIVVIYLVIYISKDNLMPKFFGNLIDVLNFYPIKFFNEIFLQENFLNLFIFIILSITIFLITSIFISKKYFDIFFNGKNEIKKKSKKNKLVNSPKKSILFKKEISLYMSYPTYISNTIFAPIVLLIFSILPLVTSPETFNELIDVEIQNIIKRNLILVICAFASIANTCYCSLSIERNTYYLLQTLPLRTIDIFKEKIKLGLSLIFIPTIISSILLGIKYNIGSLDIVILIFAALSFGLFSNLLGLIYDLKTLNISWINSKEVVKQRFSMIINQIIIALMIFISFLISDKIIKDNRTLSWLIIFLMVSILNLILVNYLRKKDLRI